jgi:integrase
MKLIKANLPAIEAAFAAFPGADKIYFDDELPGFGLRLRKGGRRGTWVCRYEYAGIQRKLTLGNTASLAPDDARVLAKKAMAYKDWFGEDPQVKKAEKRAKERLTLRYIANQYLRAKEREGLRPKSLSDATRYLLKSFRPLHNLPVHQIARRDIATVLGDLAEASPAAAGQARAYLSALFVWAIGEGLVDSNPVAGTNNPAGTREARDRVLTNDELIQIWNACADDEGSRIVKLLILTGQRRQEIGGMSWDELNPNSGTWTLPGSRSKNRREHKLPLPGLAWSIIEKVPRREANKHLFGIGSRGFGNWYKLKAALDGRCQIAKPWRLHDLRRTVATKMAESPSPDDPDVEAGLGVKPHVIEALLNHISGHKAGIVGVYNKATYQIEVKNALAIWADHVASIVSGDERKILRFPAETG